MLVTIHPNTYRTKQDAIKYTGYIQNTIVNPNNLKNVTPEELANILINGHTIIPAEIECSTLISNNDSLWTSQQVFMVDIDNDKETELHMNLQQIIDTCLLQNINPNFIYETFSSTTDHPKYRVVFISNIVIDDLDTRNKIMNNLYYLLSDGKKSAGDPRFLSPSKLCYGGIKIVYKNYNSFFDPENVINLNSDTKLSNVGENRSSLLIYNIDRQSPKSSEFLSINELRDIFHLIYLNHKPQIFPSYNTMIDYLCQEVDLYEFLNVSGKKFHCINLEHNDKEPSANIIRSNKTNQWIYKCFGCNLHGNIIRMVEQLYGFSHMKSIEFLQELYQLSYQDSDNVKMLRENLRIIKSGEIEETNPILYNVYFKNKNTYKYGFVLEEIHNIALENAYHDNKTDETIFFFSKEYFMKRINKISGSFVPTKIALTAFLKLCTKLSDDQISPDLLKESEKFKKRNNYKESIQYYKIPAYGTINLNESELRAIMFKEKQMTINGMSKELIYRSCGEEIANEVYPKQLGKELPKDSDEFQTFIEKTINKLINKKGYCKEDQLIKLYIAKNKKIIKEKTTETITEKTKEIVTIKDFDYRIIQTKLKRCLNESLEKYGYKRIKCNNEVKEKYGIKSKGYPFIIVKE